KRVHLTRGLPPKEKQTIFTYIAIMMTLHSHSVHIDDPSSLESYIGTPLRLLGLQQREVAIFSSYPRFDLTKFPPLEGGRMLKMVAEHGLAPVGHAVFLKTHPIVALHPFLGFSN